MTAPSTLAAVVERPVLLHQYDDVLDIVDVAQLPTSGESGGRSMLDVSAATAAVPPASWRKLRRLRSVICSPRDGAIAVST
jgi:hypothetical protein